MRVSRGVLGTIAAAAMAMAMAQAAPARAVPTASETTAGWHWVHEGWAPYTQPDVTFPAAKYCGSFDLTSTVVSQDIRYKVLSRWDNGTPRQTFYEGPLVMDVSNATTGTSANYFMGGDAIETDDATGAVQTYQMLGPVGFGMPIGASRGIAAGVYVFSGNHVVQFNADGTRTLTTASGTATDLCTALS